MITKTTSNNKPIIIQLIDIFWTKKSRGAPQSIKRNSIPETHPLGHCELKESIHLQNIKYSESDDFSQALVSEIKPINENQQRDIRLKFVQEKDSVSVLSWGIPGHEIYGKEKYLGTLTENTWLKKIGNVRIPTERTWTYHKFVYNIFFGEPEKFDDIISNLQPISEFRHKALLI